jgi:O-antigen/teichoic acid export membrane protein
MFVRLLRGTGANAFGQLVIVALQLVMVPTLATHWGLERYGLWLLLCTVPFYLGLADFGFTTASTNEMIMKVECGDRDGAIATFQSAWAVVVCCSTLIAFIALSFCLLLPDRFFAVAAVDTVEVRGALAVLSIYGLVCLQSNIVLAGFKCSGHYATGTMSGALVQFCEGLVAISVVAVGGSVWHLALAYLLSRFCGVVVQVLWLHHSIPWLRINFTKFQLQETKRLMGPAIAVTASATAQAMVLQGTAVTLGAAASVSMVAVFTTVRTLTRTGIQLTTLVNNAAMPEHSAAVAREDRNAQARMVVLALATSAIILIPAAIILLLWGQTIIAVWTRSVVHPSQTFLVVMIAVMLLNGIWFPISNLILAANRHGLYSYVYLVAATVSVVLSYPLAMTFGATGAGTSLLLLDIFMFVYVMRLAAKIIASPSEIVGSMRALLSRLTKAPDPTDVLDQAD